MNKKRQTIDGFVPRRPKTENLAPQKRQKKPAVVRKQEVKKEEKSLDDALNTIEIEEKKTQNLHHISGERTRRLIQHDSEKSKITPKLEKKLEKFNSKREKKGKKPISMKRFLIGRKIRNGILAIFLIFAVFFGPKIYGAINSALKGLNGLAGGGGSIFDFAKTEKLKSDDAGRTNILIFGTSPEGWDGEDLADSIMVLTHNQETGASQTISLPRDLWVKHTCPYFLGTTAGKLNESYACGKFSQGMFDGTETAEEKSKAEKLGQDELSKAVEKVLGLKIHYVVHGNWQVLVQAIDAIGGIDVKVEVWDGSPAMYDVATKVKYKNGEVAHMNGEQALAFSRARGSAGGYGLSGGNFDRERNQQKVLKATLEKVNKEKFNIDALTKIADSLGENIKTTFSVSEIRTAMDIALKVKSENLKSLPLVDSKEGRELMTTDNISGASVVVPSEGTFDYSEIQKFIAKNTKTGDFISEEAKIVILNGTETSGLAGKKKTELETDGFEISAIGDSPEKGLKETAIYQISEKVPASIKKLKEKLNVSKVQDLPSNFENYRKTADIVVVLGED